MGVEFSPEGKLPNVRHASPAAINTPDAINVIRDHSSETTPAARADGARVSLSSHDVPSAIFTQRPPSPDVVTDSRFDTTMSMDITGDSPRDVVGGTQVELPSVEKPLDAAGGGGGINLPPPDNTSGELGELPDDQTVLEMPKVEQEKVLIATRTEPSVNEAAESEGSTQPYTGMVLPETAERERITQIIMEAEDVSLREGAAAANKVALALNDMPGMEVVEPGYDSSEQCMQYVFGKKYGDVWVSLSSPESEFQEFLNADDQASFLATKGYDVVKNPLPGDVVGYGVRDDIGWRLYHVGIYEEDGKVESKFGSGQVVRHSLGLVPSYWRNDVIFFRRESPELNKS